MQSNSKLVVAENPMHAFMRRSENVVSNIELHKESKKRIMQPMKNFERMRGHEACDFHVVLSETIGLVAKQQSEDDARAQKPK